MTISENRRAAARQRREHPAEVRGIYQRALAGSAAHGRFVEVGGHGVHLLETGAGPPVVLLHGTSSSALFLLPLLANLGRVQAIAPDRPGQGLSDPIDLPRDRYRQAAVGWVDRLLDTLGLDSAAVVGHSAGGLWALWYALAHPERVRRLGVIGAPALPGTCAPLPYRLIATPGVGEMVRRVPPTPGSVRRFARFMGEGATLVNHPDLIDLMVAAGRDPVAGPVDTSEARVIASPLALLSRSGFRRRTRVGPPELRRLATPTLVVWGDRDPVGTVAAARAVTQLIPNARLATVAAGHAPWLGCPEQTAAIIADFVQEPNGGGTP
jgi:pimeloyl-ACP methyl ester carboxylesterase